MGGIKTSSNFYRRGISNSNGNFAFAVSSNYPIIQPQYLVINPKQSLGFVTEGLLFNIQANKPASYSGSGSVWYNIGTGGSTYDVTLLYSPTFILDGLKSYFEFDGITQCAEFIRPLQDDFSWGVWFNTTSTAGDPNSVAWYQTGNMQIIGGDSYSNLNDYGVAMGGGRIFFGTGNPDTTINSTSLSLNDGNWHYLVATRKRSTGVISLYIDGILNSSINTTNTESLNSTGTLHLANESFGNYNYYTGKISIVQGYTITLNSSEVVRNYNAQKIFYV